MKPRELGVSTTSRARFKTRGCDTAWTAFWISTLMSWIPDPGKPPVPLAAADGDV
jgi:hypothetical protein